MRPLSLPNVLMLVLVMSGRRSDVAHALGTAARHARGDNSGGLGGAAAAGERRVVTDMLRAGPAAREARQAMEVRGVGNHTSYAGFFQVANETAGYQSFMYSWYFPPMNGNKDAPLLIWLQGGPGGSSLFGLFVEMGPFRVNEQGVLEEMPYTWNDEYGMLFIDNPVGAGFSYTTSDVGYCTSTRTCVADNLYALLQQFYAVFPELLSNELFVTGESYGGHYVPAIGYTIHERNLRIERGARLPIAGLPSNFVAARLPLAGVAIGDGWVDPVEMVKGYSALFDSMSLANVEQRTRIKAYQDAMSLAIYKEEFYDAFKAWDEFLNGDVYPYKSYFYNITGSSNYDNILRTEAPPEFGRHMKFLADPNVRRAIHVGDAKYQDGHACELHLLNDFMVSYKPELAGLMEAGYAVLVYSGQLDLIVASPLTEAYLPTIPWRGAADFAAAPRHVWRVNEADAEVAGFVQSARTFTRAVIRAAGHILPFDQPRVARAMLSAFVQGTPPFAGRTLRGGSGARA